MVRVVQSEPRVKPKKQVLTDKLSRLNKKGGEEFTARLAAKLGLPYADLHIVPISSEDVLVIPEQIATDLQLICFRKKGKKLTLGTPNPASEKVIEYVKHLETKKGWTITLAAISPSSLNRGLVAYRHVYFVEELNTLRLSLDNQDVEQFEKGIGRILELKNRADELSTTEILTIIFAGAVSLGASDIHIEPQKTDVRLRYRVDGVLKDIVVLPLTSYKTIISRLKLMSNMKINVRDRAQDGRFSVDVEGKQIDMRASTIPSKNAEGIVLRLLSGENLLESISDLGLRGKAYDDLKKTLEKTDGIVLTTGPTGSGKTTTLYTIVSHINTPEAKIVTIENPIEYEMAGIVQTEIASAEGYTFAKALRAMVRQDPDIILVGEIRDDETADVAMNAALTGHLVLSTLHTNGAAATVARLMELGVRPTLIPPAADIFLAQRLVRKLCECKEVYEPALEVAEDILGTLSLISPKAGVDIPTAVTELYRPVGCPQCHGSGYKGRIGIFEVLTINQEIEELILAMEGETAITKAAIEDGFVTLAQDGVLKALSGITSLEEVWRVTSESGIVEDLYEKLTAGSLTRRLSITGDHTEKAKADTRHIEKIEPSLLVSDDSDILPLVFAYALALRASDIHVEPSEDGAVVRLRIDGALQTVAKIQKPHYNLILAQVKDYAGLSTSVRQGVSDSRFGIYREDGEADQRKIDVRTSIIVSGFGETLVMRILLSSDTEGTLDTLGVTPYNRDRILAHAKKPHGIVLNTGPTGSGKTTTLYSILHAINDQAKKIITVEDPIEYQVSGILQTQVDNETDYTFATALRALLRQDPDVIMVGEIRDKETAATAISAAQTGHLIISTLHTNSAASTIGRLSSLGIASNDLTAAVTAIMAQRLVRKLCKCKETVEMTPEQKDKINTILSDIAPSVSVSPKQTTHLFSPQGCDTCNGLGYRGRTVISEVLAIDPQIAKLIMTNPLPSEIAKAAVTAGMLTMEQDGILKTLSGETTLEEIERSTMM